MILVMDYRVIEKAKVPEIYEKAGRQCRNGDKDRGVFSEFFMEREYVLSTKVTHSLEVQNT